MIELNKKHIKKILIIKLRGIGDVVLSTVTFENLKQSFPNAQIDFLTEKASYDFLNNLDFINEVILFNRNNTWERFKQLFQIRNKKYDLVIDFFSNPATALVTFFSGAKYKAGYPYKGRIYAYNIFGPPERNKYHAAELHLKLLENIGINIISNNLHFGIDNNSSNYAKEYFKNNFDDSKLVIGISPSGGWNSKKCDPDKFVEIADYLSVKFNSQILIIWGPGDKSDAELIFNNMKQKAIMAPNTTIIQMAALISNCDILIANDSGPMHISTALETPTLSLHGPTDPKLQGPYSDKHEWINDDKLDCIICNLLECNRNHECFYNLKNEDILKKVRILIQKNKIVKAHETN